jgi:KUP system potassium uptake protein
VFLAVTGTEALYADLGHFGRRAIRLAWFTVVFPGLVLNYLGQAALLKAEPAARVNPFYHLVGPDWVMPLTVLATVAAIIASQALISGAFSMTSQAIQLGCLPRMTVRYTSSTQKGQVYIPLVNWMLMICCVLLVLIFKGSGKLAGAYGIGISLTMVVTTILFRAAGRSIWGWSRLKANLIAGTFLTIDTCFFSANSLKLFHGGTLPLAIAAVLVFLMVTWRWGRARLMQRMEKQSMPVDLLVAEAQRKPIHRVPGTAVFLSGKKAGVPVSLLHNLKHNQILHEHVILMHVETLDVPTVQKEDRVRVEDLGSGFHLLTVRFGFSETPDVPAAMKLHMPAGLSYDHARITFFLGRESYAVARDTRGFNRLRLAIFSWMSRNSTAATAYFRLPPSRVVELGAQLTL